MPRVAASSRLIAYSSAVRRSRAPATRVCCRTLAIRLAMTSATSSMTAKVTRYCSVGDREREARRHEEEIERQHVRDRGQDRRAAPEPQAGDGGAEQVDHDEIGELEVIGTSRRPRPVHGGGDRERPAIAIPADRLREFAARRSGRRVRSRTRALGGGDRSRRRSGARGARVRVVVEGRSQARQPRRLAAPTTMRVALRVARIRAAPPRPTGRRA